MFRRAVALANICIVLYVPAVPCVAAFMIEQGVEEANTRILPLCQPCRGVSSLTVVAAYLLDCVNSAGVTLAMCL